MAVKYTEEQLNSVDKSFLIQLLLQQQEQLEAITKELHASNEKMQLLMEQVILGKQNRFGRSSEKMEDTSQICFREVDGTIVFFNEAEAVCDLNAAEPEDLELKSPKQPKRKGKKEADLSGLPFRRIDHYLSEEELEAEFGVKGWKQLPDAISRKYHFVPAKVEVEEHHIGVYASKTDEHMVKADHPKALLHGSLVSPSLGAAIINGKYVNAVPLYRLEQEFQRYGLQITRQNMANWCIRLTEEYLSILCVEVHGLSCDSDGIESGYDYSDAEVVSIRGISSRVRSIDEITDETAWATLLCTASIDVVCSYEDYDNAVWDSETRSYYCLETRKNLEKHLARFGIRIELDRKENNLKIVPFKVILNGDTIRDRFEIDEDEEEYDEMDIINQERTLMITHLS